jgi:hypothetical protein
LPQHRPALAAHRYGRAMAFMKDAKIAILWDAARKAHDDPDQVVFVARLNMPGGQSGAAGEVAEWSAMIQAVERTGWALHNWAVGPSNMGIGVFRRR